MKVAPFPRDRIHFPSPTVITLKSTRKVAPVTQTTPHVGEIRAEYERKTKIFMAKKQDAIAQGFEKYSIVSPRYIASIVPALDGQNWGIVIGHPLYHMEEEKFKPITVRWLTKGKLDSSYNPDELFLIMTAVPEDDLKLFLQVQKEELENTKC